MGGGPPRQWAAGRPGSNIPVPNAPGGERRKKDPERRPRAARRRACRRRASAAREQDGDHRDRARRMAYAGADDRARCPEGGHRRDAEQRGWRHLLCVGAVPAVYTARPPPARRRTRPAPGPPARSSSARCARRRRAAPGRPAAASAPRGAAPPLPFGLRPRGPAGVRTGLLPTAADGLAGAPAMTAPRMRKTATPPWNVPAQGRS